MAFSTYVRYTPRIKDMNMHIIRLSDAKLETSTQQPLYNCWTWLDEGIAVFHNDYPGDGIQSPKGELTYVYIDHVQTHELTGLKTPTDIWSLLSETCLDHGYLCESLDDLNRPIQPLPEHFNDV